MYNVDKSVAKIAFGMAFIAAMWGLFFADHWAIPSMMLTANIIVLMIFWLMLKWDGKDIVDADCRVIVLKNKTDVIVMEFPGAISQQTAEFIKKHVEDTFPGHKCLVIGDGLTMKVVQNDNRI